MCQENVYKLLKEKKEWMSVMDILEELDQSRSSISTNLKKLFKAGDILLKEGYLRNTRMRKYLYKIK